jgi:hypothetical protein
MAAPANLEALQQVRQLMRCVSSVALQAEPCSSRTVDGGGRRRRSAEEQTAAHAKRRIHVRSQML